MRNSRAVIPSRTRRASQHRLGVLVAIERHRPAASEHGYISVERMAAGAPAWRFRERLAAAIAHFLR